MIGAVVQRNFDVFDFIAGKNTTFHGFLDALLHRLDVFLRNRTADDRILEDESGSDGARLDGNTDMAVLTAAAGLAYVFALGVGFGPNRFLVSNLGLAYIRADVELT